MLHVGRRSILILTSEKAPQDHISGKTPLHRRSGHVGANTMERPLPLTGAYALPSATVELLPQQLAKYGIQHYEDKRQQAQVLP